MFSNLFFQVYLKRRLRRRRRRRCRRRRRRRCRRRRRRRRHRRYKCFDVWLSDFKLTLRSRNFGPNDTIPTRRLNVLFNQK